MTTLLATWATAARDLPQPAWLSFDRQLRCVDCDAGARQLTERSPTAMVGQLFSTLFSEQGSSLLLLMARALHGTQSATLYQQEHTDWRVEITPVIGRSGLTIGVELAFTPQSNPAFATAAVPHDPRHTLQQLQRVTDTALSQLEFDALLTELLYRVYHALGADEAVALLVDAAGETLVVRTTTGNQHAQHHPQRVSLHTGFVGRVVAAQRPVLESHPQGILDLGLHQTQPYRTVLGVPLIAQRRLLGVVVVNSQAEHAFSAEHIGLVERVADRLAVATLHTRLRAAEQALRTRAEQDDALISLLVQNAPIGWAFIDRNLRFVRLNAMIAKMNGRSIDAHIGRTPSELFPNIGPMLERQWQHVLDTGEPLLDLEMSGVSAGVPRSVVVSYYPVRTSAGIVIGIGVVMQDVSERRHAEERQQLLAEMSRCLAASFDLNQTLSAVGQLLVPRFADCYTIDLLDERGAIQLAALEYADPTRAQTARALRDQYVMDPKSRSGIPFVIRSGEPLLLPTIDDALITKLAHGAAEAEHLRMIGYRSVIIVPLIARGHVLGALLLATDASDRSYTTEDLASAQELAQRIAQAVDNAQLYGRTEEAVRARDSFISIAAHELRTPLTSLYGQAQLLSRRLSQAANTSERDQRAIETIVTQAERLRTMINDLLDLSRVEAGQLAISRVNLDLTIFIQQVLDELRGTLDQHTLEYQHADEPVRISGDPQRIEQVLFNLVTNAVKYSPHGGSIAISLARQDDFAVLRICDQGVGIPTEALPRLFTRFYRAPNVKHLRIGGVGVGLYVVREIVQQHGGAITVHSEEGHGSCFTVTLPLV